MYLEALINQWQDVLLWGFVATGAMASILSASQGLGFSRLSLPFIVGTFFVNDRYIAQIVGFVLYIIGGSIFAALYFAIFVSLGWSSWWLGLLLGILHGLFLLLAVLPVLPYLHPRMATEYDGPMGVRRLEPPGFMGLNYGFRTPATTLLGQAVYGLLLGFGLHVNL